MSPMLAVCFGVMGLIVWFKTDFRVHLFNTIYDMELDSSNINEFIVLKFDDPIFKTKFTTAGLITCPFCLGVWLAAATSIFAGPLCIGVIYVLQMALFYFFD